MMKKPTGQCPHFPLSKEGSLSTVKLIAKRIQYFHCGEKPISLKARGPQKQH